MLEKPVQPWTSTMGKRVVSSSQPPSQARQRSTRALLAMLLDRPEQLPSSLLPPDLVHVEIKADEHTGVRTFRIFRDNEA